jgi:hypothetical protein
LSPSRAAVPYLVNLTFGLNSEAIAGVAVFGIRGFLTSGSNIRDGKSPDPGYGMDIPEPDHISESSVNILWVKYTKNISLLSLADPEPVFFLPLDPGYGMEKVRIRDKPTGSSILDSQHWQQSTVYFCV